MVEAEPPAVTRKDSASAASADPNSSLRTPFVFHKPDGPFWRSSMSKLGSRERASRGGAESAQQRVASESASSDTKAPLAPGLPKLGRSSSFSEPLALVLTAAQHVELRVLSAGTRAGAVAAAAEAGPTRIGQVIPAPPVRVASERQTLRQTLSLTERNLHARTLSFEAERGGGFAAALHAPADARQALPVHMLRPQAWAQVHKTDSIFGSRMPSAASFLLPLASVTGGVPSAAASAAASSGTSQYVHHFGTDTRARPFSGGGSRAPGGALARSGSGRNTSSAGSNSSSIRDDRDAMAGQQPARPASGGMAEARVRRPSATLVVGLPRVATPAAPVHTGGALPLQQQQQQRRAESELPLLASMRSAGASSREDPGAAARPLGPRSRTRPRAEDELIEALQNGTLQPDAFSKQVLKAQKSSRHAALEQLVEKLHIAHEQSRDLDKRLRTAVHHSASCVFASTAAPDRQAIWGEGAGQRGARALTAAAAGGPGCTRRRAPSAGRSWRPAAEAGGQRLGAGEGGRSNALQPPTPSSSSSSSSSPSSTPRNGGDQVLRSDSAAALRPPSFGGRWQHSSSFGGRGTSAEGLAQQQAAGNLISLFGPHGWGTRGANPWILSEAALAEACPLFAAAWMAVEPLGGWGEVGETLEWVIDGSVLEHSVTLWSFERTVRSLLPECLAGHIVDVLLYSSDRGTFQSVSGEAIGSPVCVSTHAFFDQTMVHVPEVSEDGRYSDWDRSRDAERRVRAGSVVAIPLFRLGRDDVDAPAVGVLQLTTTVGPAAEKDGSFSPADLASLSAIAPIVAALLDRASASRLLTGTLEAARLHDERSLRLSRVLRQVMPARTFTGICSAVRAALSELLDATDAALLRFDSAAETLTTAGLAGRHVVSTPVDDAGIVAAALHGREPVNVADVHRDPRFREQGDKLARRSALPAKSMLCVRVSCAWDEGDEPALGVLQAINKRSSPAFTQEDERLIMEFTSQLGAVLPGIIQNEMLQDTLREEIESATKAHRAAPGGGMVL